MFGKNIKVHFAGTEQPGHCLVCKYEDIKYCLFTVFPYIASKMGIQPYPLFGTMFSPHELEKFTRHTIMDSGLFTLMFGAKAGKRDEKFMDVWLELLCAFVQENNLKCTCVEVDCQKVLGVEQAWKYRKRMREKLPNNRIVNVFHLEDGKNGLDSMIDFAEYIAISVPELRIHKRKTYKQDVYRLASYIKNKKPNIDIHLLGCTELGLLKSCNFCTSSDSTSYLSSVRYGTICGYHISQLNKEFISEKTKMAEKIIYEIGTSTTPGKVRAAMLECVSAHILKKKYEKAAGPQD